MGVLSRTVIEPLMLRLLLLPRNIDFLELSQFILEICHFDGRFEFLEIDEVEVAVFLERFFNVFLVYFLELVLQSVQD